MAGLTSVNGWPVLLAGSTKLRRFQLPGAGRGFTLRDGSAGFLLMHLLLWWHEELERLDLGTWDEWGHAVRPVRGQLTGYSNHASGTAADANATKHPQHVPVLDTFTPAQVRRLRRRLRMYAGLLAWGGDWRAVDGMHVELAPGTTLRQVERRARLLMLTPRGRRILRANPGLRAVILS